MNYSMSSMTIMICLITGIISGCLVGDNIFPFWVIFTYQLPLAVVLHKLDPFFKVMLDE